MKLFKIKILDITVVDSGFWKLTHLPLPPPFPYPLKINYVMMTYFSLI